MSITPFLMFEGRAAEAMSLYLSVFPGARLLRDQRYGAGEGAPEGTVKQATIELDGMPVMLFDSPSPHAFTFTPSISFFVQCDSAEALDRIFDALADGGTVMMPIDNYGFSPRFGWVQDRFGVSWQLNLPAPGAG